MQTTKGAMPEWFRDLNPDAEVFFDMGRYLRHGMEPLAEIQEVLGELRPCQYLHLISTREPELLCRVFRPSGFESYFEKNGGTWDIFLKKADALKGGKP